MANVEEEIVPIILGPKNHSSLLENFKNKLVLYFYLILQVCNSIFALFKIKIRQMSSSHSHSHNSKVTLAGLLITLGIIFGDIGTSPLYVIQAIVKDRVVTEELILGGFCPVYSGPCLLLQHSNTFLALNADNNGEGGIFALYAQVRRFKSPYVIYPAIIGCATLIADGFITPRFRFLPQ